MKNETERACVREFLLAPASYPGNVHNVEYIETHISEVFLTGTLAYKIKKNLNLGFLDFSTLSARKFYTERELSLNKRYAPELYREVIPLYLSGSTVSFKPIGEVCEYVLVMNQFAQEDLFSSMSDSERLTVDHIVEVVKVIASFHTLAEAKPTSWSYADVQELAMDNISVLKSFAATIPEREMIDELEHLLKHELQAKKEYITKRQVKFVRALHGDLHLKNICLYRGRATIFDGLEFNERYSAIDTWADFAFLTMDLAVRGKDSLRIRAVNEYLERTDDFEGVSLLRLYESYRAAVRAKVAALKLNGKNVFNNEKISQLISYATFALKKKCPHVVFVGGLSGSGKSTLSNKISEITGSVVIRSDAVRKHLLSVSLEEKVGSSGYTHEVSERVYREMFSRALMTLNEGYSVILDATFQDKERRSEAEIFFNSKNFQTLGFWCEVSEEIAVTRIRARTGDVSDADEHVLKSQLLTFKGGVNWVHIDTTILGKKILDDIKGKIDDLCQR